MKLKDKIPEKFYKGSLKKPTAKTVGDLKRQLDKLPNTLNIEQGFGKGVGLVVYNINQHDIHLGFTDVSNSY